MRRMLLVSLAATLIVAALPVPALSAAERTKFTATAVLTSFGGGEVRFSGESEVVHIRGRTFVFDVTGDLTGTLTAVTDFNIRFDTGDGTLFGTFVLSAGEVTWEGHFSGTLAGGVVESITQVGQGSDGTKVMSTMTQTGPGQFALEGVILDPAG